MNEGAEDEDDDDELVAAALTVVVDTTGGAMVPASVVVPTLEHLTRAVYPPPSLPLTSTRSKLAMPADDLTVKTPLNSSAFASPAVVPLGGGGGGG